MSETDYKIGTDHASKNWQPSPPDPQKTWEQNNAYWNGYVQEQQRIEQERRHSGY